MKRYLCLLLLLLSVPALAMQPLTLASLPQLQSQFAGKRHALIFWSLSCVPCHQELEALSQLPSAKTLPISLINTDGQAQQAEAKAFLARFGLQSLDNWVFADAIPERLRAAFDSNWYGELPRSYVVDAKGVRLGHSGKADMTQLLSWLTVK